MHETSMQNMATVKQLYLDPFATSLSRPLSVVDIGSMDINGSYRHLFDQRLTDYRGVDLEPGPGVDVVLDDPATLPFDDHSVDVLLSGQMLEHGEFFWESMREMARVLSPAGYLVIIAPSAGPIHRYPVDCYRFYPDALPALAKWAGLELIDWYHDQRGEWKDLVGVFRHPGAPESGGEQTLAEAIEPDRPYLGVPRPHYPQLGPVEVDPWDVTGPALFTRATSPALWPIDTVRASAWNGHIPFMFVIFNLLRPRRYVELGCHDGGSFFAACQARQRLELGTDCVAIDTWAGDPHAGFYGPEVLASVTAGLQAQGHSFAILEQMLFAEAAPKFADESIDLLLIDGLHTYEAVKEDFETWRPKMAPGGVIMVHDIAEHDDDFGVWRLWGDIAAEHETYELRHAHGLGIALVPGGSSPVPAFFEMLRGEPALGEHFQALLETIAQRSLSHAQLPDAAHRAEVWQDHAYELEAEHKRGQDRIAELEAQSSADEAAWTSAVADAAGQRDRLEQELRGLHDLKVMRLMRVYWRLRQAGSRHG